MMLTTLLSVVLRPAKLHAAMCATRDVDGSILRSKPHLYATARQVTPFCFCHVPRPVLTLLQPVRSAATGSISYHSSKSSMKRKSAIVTGSASGIGQALVEQLVSREGYKALTLIDLDASALMAQQQQLQQQRSGVDILIVAADVCDNKEMQRAVNEHMARFQTLDLAVLNAGIGERGDFLDPNLGTEALEKTLDVDLRAVITGVRYAAQAMIAAGNGGRIISIASAAGIFPMTAGPYYAAAKAGVVHFTRSLAPRLAPQGIQLAAICPQYVDTPLVQNMLKQTPDVAKAMMGPLSGQPLLKPQQVVDLIINTTHKPLPQKGRSVPFKEAYAGAGCVFLLLQNANVVDPFAASTSNKVLQGARTVTASTLTSKQQKQQEEGQPQGLAQGSSQGRNRGNSNKSDMQLRINSKLSAKSAASMVAFSDAGALRAFAQQQLPASYNKLQVVELSNSFRQAVRQVSVPIPSVPPGHVLVRRLFVGINASDVNFTSGRYHSSKSAAAAALPFDAGFESVGVVVAAATDAGIPVGSAAATMDAGFSEYALVQNRRVLAVPCPAPEVVALLTSGLTASLALSEVGRLQLPGFSSAGLTPQQQQQQKTVLVTAAAGGTGQFAVQLAKLAGCHVVATCGGAQKAQLLKELGVDRAIDYKAEDVKSTLKREYPKGIDLVYESVGGDMFSTCVDALAPKGTLIVIGMMSAYGDNWPASSYPGLTEKLLWKSAAVAGFFLLRYANLWGSHLQQLCKLVQEGQLAVALDPKPFKGIEAVAAAVEHLHSGSSSGKVVVQLSRELPNLQQSRL